MAKETKQIDKIVLPEGCTQEMVNGWKEKLGDKLVRVQEVESQDDLHDPFSIVTRVPDRRTMEMFQKFVDRDPGKAYDILKKNCILFGAEQLEGNDYKTLSAIDALASLIPTSKVITKNL